jgi:endonuclease YncB( thermonuclease family)
VSRLLAAALLLLAVAGCSGSAAGETAARPAGVPAATVGIADAANAETDTVTRVHDGDTFYTLNHSDGVRLIGADTPEITKNKHGNYKIGCWGKAATARLADLLPVGSQVRLTLGGHSHDRVLADVTNQGGVNVARTLIAEGYATVEVVKPNTSHRADYEAALAQAQANRLGEWSGTNPPGAPAGCVNPLQPKGS